MTLNLSLVGTGGYPKSAPLETKRIRSCLLEYDDGTTYLLEVEADQGFHRVSEYSSNGKILTTHEVFITYGKRENE